MITDYREISPTTEWTVISHRLRAELFPKRTFRGKEDAVVSVRLLADSRQKSLAKVLSLKEYLERLILNFPGNCSIIFLLPLFYNTFHTLIP